MRRRRNHNGYGSYYGRSGFRTFLKVLIALLLLALVLMAGAFLLLERYWVYGQDGPRLDLPFLHQQEPAESQEPEESVPVVVVTPSPTPAPQYLKAVMLPRTALYDGTAARRVAAAGGNAALFDMKADDGSLGYTSGLALATAVGASDANPALNTAIRALGEGDLCLVARVSCFRDNLAPKEKPALAIKTNSGYNWRDEGEIRWLSPANEEARQYVAGICQELAGLGFDEIVLDYAAYPTRGKLAYIKKGAAYDQDQFAAVVAGFYAQVKSALSAYPGVKLSVVTDTGVLTTGSDPASGQLLTGMAAQADRLWAPLGGTPHSQYALPLSAAGVEDPADALVSLSPAAGGADGSWAIVPEEA